MNNKEYYTQTKRRSNMDKKEMLKWIELIYQEIGSMPEYYGLGLRYKETLEDIMEALKEEVDE